MGQGLRGGAADRAGYPDLVPQRWKYRGDCSRIAGDRRDDLESGAIGWTHGDFTVGVPPKFHVDDYMAYVAPGRQDNHSWWCGEFGLPYDLNGDGGYANDWDQRLDVPATSCAGYIYPLILFQYRNATEPGFDFSYVQAESNGVFVDLNAGYDGVRDWREAGYYLGNKDEPAV